MKTPEETRKAKERILAAALSDLAVKVTMPPQSTVSVKQGKFQKVWFLRGFVYADSDTRRARVENIYHEPAGDWEKLEKKRASYYQHYTGNWAMRRITV